MRYLISIITFLSAVQLFIPAAHAQTTLRDAIYLYDQDFLAGGAKRIVGSGCDVFQLVLDVDQGSTGIKMAQYNSSESANYSDYPDAITSSAKMFSYMQYESKDYKVFKFDGAGAAGSKIGSGTVFGYCLSSNPGAKVYLVEWDKCLITYSNNSTLAISPSQCTPTNGSVTPAPSEPQNKTYSARMIGGTWTFSYTISTTTFQNFYTFTSVDSSPNAEGNYFVNGVDQYNNVVISSYSGQNSIWAAYDPGTIIDRFFTFTFSDDNHVSGCYYQVDPPGSTNTSKCYPMIGVRSGKVGASLRSKASASGTSSASEELELREAAEDAAPGFIEPEALEILRSLQ